MKKICFCTDTVFSIGGIQKVVIELANNLCKEYDVTILCLRKVKDFDKMNFYLNSRIVIQYLPESHVIPKLCNAVLKPLRYFCNNILKISSKTSIYSFLNYYCKFHIIDSLNNFFEKNKYDYILAEGLQNCIYMSFINSNIISDSKVIGCWHSSFDNYFNNYNKKLIIYTIRKQFKTIVLSKTDRDMIKKNMGFDVCYIYNPIINNRYIFNDKSKRFISVGRYVKVKGFDKLIEAFSIFNKYNKEWKLYIVGDGPERRTLQKMIDSYNLNDFIFLTGKTSDVDEYYNSSSIYLLSSLAEGFPMVVLEAMQHKLPIISFDIPIMHEILPNSELIQKGDCTAFARRMIELTSKPLKEENYDAILADKYIEKIISEWKNILL